ncbi:5-hydroxytryptamine receptor 1A-alpha [Holothuria leucospilota]|uniref:5-hydroxytryptamine receptor 1A-alpha n=1 Tax=Holothuria leucospilota TaxID=206669 RepID=A0A9Q1CI20_HOLLE|nr:5-hydroxytryptamine receptor 1A-alpha [Holothuria leucospilota]
MEALSASTVSLVEDDLGSAKVSLEDISQVIYLLFGILGLFGNSLVLMVIARVKSLRTVTNLFIANQSLIDFTTSVFLLILMYDPPKYDFSHWELNSWTIFVCYFWQSDYIFWSLMGSSTGNLILLTLERWVAVLYPVVYRNRVNWKTATVFAILPWILGFLFQLFWPAVHHFEDGACFPSYSHRSVQVAVGVFVFVAKLVLPVMIMFMAYASILRRIKPKFLQVGITNRTRSARIIATATDSIGETKQAPVLRTDLTTAWTRSLAPAPVTAAINAPIFAPGIPPVENLPAASDAAHFTFNTNRIRLNILKTVFIVIIVFVICWTPVNTVFLIYNLGGNVTIRGTLHKLTWVLVFVNIWINPVIYTFKYRKFQDGLRKTFRIPLKEPRVGSQTNS